MSLFSSAAAKVFQLTTTNGTQYNAGDVFDKSNSIRTVDEFEAAVHDGLAFSFSGNGTLAASGTLSIYGVTGSLQVHFDGMDTFLSQGAVLMEFFEAPTVSANGTLQTPQRRNRANSAQPTMAIYINPTITSTGTLMANRLFPSIGQGANVQAGSVGVSEGWVLKANTGYIIRITNQASTATTYSFNFAWHEANYIV